jgi:hypothetical protein
VQSKTRSKQFFRRCKSDIAGLGLYESQALTVSTRREGVNEVNGNGTKAELIIAQVSRIVGCLCSVSP